MKRNAFLRRAGYWAAALLAVFVAYSATHFWGQPNPVARFLAMLAENLPGFAALVLPPAVFAGAMRGCGLFDGTRTNAPVRSWGLLLGLSWVAYALGALVEPMLAAWTGSDWQFPVALLEAARGEQAGAEAAMGNLAARHLRRAGNYLVQLYVPIANAAFVIVAAALGEITGLMTRAVSLWYRFAARWLAGGLLVSAFWISVILTSELVAYQGAWEGLLLVLPLCLPLLLAGILIGVLWPKCRVAR